VSIVEKMVTVRSQLASVERLLHTVTSMLQSDEVIAAANRRRSAEHEFWRQLGWPPAGHLPVAKLDRLITGFRNGEIERVLVVREIIEHYRPEQLLRMLEEWHLNSWLAHRVKILTTAIELHIEGRYEASIPTLLPQIEGVVVDHSGITGRSQQRKVIEATQKLLGVEDAEPDASGYNVRIAEWVEKEFFHGFDLGASIEPELLSRNAILHGYDTDYASEEKSLRCILVFDHLQMVLAQLETQAESETAGSVDS
jgi:hypothetical protein